jgi:hypothetical protein
LIADIKGSPTSPSSRVIAVIGRAEPALYSAAKKRLHADKPQSRKAGRLKVARRFNGG